MNSNKSTLGWDAIYLTGSKLLVAIIGLVTSMLLARFRNLAEYGTYSQLIMVTDLAASIFLLGIPNSINYFLAKTDDERERQSFLSVYLTLSTIFTAIIGISLYLSMPLIIEYFNNPMIETFAYVFAIYPWSSIMINSIGNTCIVCGKAKKLVIYNIANAIVVLGILIIAKTRNWSFQQYMIGYMATLTLFALGGIGWMRALIGRIKPSLKPNLIKEIIKFSIPMGLATVVGTLNVELDKFIIGGFFSTDEYAIYAIAAKEIPVTMVTVSLTAVLLPQMVRLATKNEVPEMIRLWGHAIVLSLCFMSLIVGGFIVFAPDILSLFYSEKYVTGDSIIIFRIYSCVLLFRAIYWGIILNATGNTKFIFYSSLLTLVLNLIGNVAFYYIFGFIGPALSTLAVIALMAFLQLKFTSKIIHVSILRIFPWSRISKLLVKMLIFCTTFYYIKYYIIGYSGNSTSIIISIVLGIFWTITYGIVNKNLISHSWLSLNNK